MKEINELNIPEDLRYTDDHEWAKQTGETIKIGVSDYAQDQLGDIVFVEFPEVGDTFDKGDEFAEKITYRSKTDPENLIKRFRNRSTSYG